MDISVASEVLGMPESEIVDVADSNIGTLVRTFDNNVLVVDDDDKVMFLVSHGTPFPAYTTPTGDAKTWRSVRDRENEVLDQLGVELDAALLRSGSPEALASGDPVLRAQPGEQDAQAEQHITDPGPGRGESAPNPDTGARNIADPADSTDAGTVVPIDGSERDIEAWAGDDAARLQQALDAEQAKDRPRPRLVKKLSEKLGQPVRHVEGV